VESIGKTSGRHGKESSERLAAEKPIIVDAPAPAPLAEAAGAVEPPVRLPDDPGVDPEDEATAAPGRFRLF
jgi:HemY protein